MPLLNQFCLSVKQKGRNYCSKCKYACVHIFREPQTVADCIASLRTQMNFTMPVTEEDWINAERTEIDVRRSHILADALKEGHKRRFDSTKLLKVF